MDIFLVKEEREIFGHKIIELKVRRKIMKAEKLSGNRTAHCWAISGMENRTPFGFYVDEVFLPTEGFYTKFSAENAKIGFGISKGKYCIVVESAENVKTETLWKWDPDKPRHLAKSVTVE